VSSGDGLGGRRKVLIAGLVLILAGVALIAGAGWAKYGRVRTCAASTLEHLDTLQELAPASSLEGADLDLLEIGVQLHGLQNDLACLDAEAGELLALAPMLGWLPRVGDDIAIVPDLLEMAQALVDAGVLVTDGLSPLLADMQARDAGDPDAGEATLDLAEAVSALEAAQPSLATAGDKLERAWDLQLELEKVALSPRVGRLLDLTGRYLPLLRTGVRAAQIAPELMAAEGQRTYLILAQNDDERRPTGGWISGYGLVTLEQGEISEVTFSDSWAADNLQVPHEIPPESMLRALWAEIWLFRDANWSPDFPTSAQVAEAILLRDQGIAVDGVFAVDQRALQLLVGALAPLDVASSDQPITASNLLAFMRDAWAQPEDGVAISEDWSDWVARRKDFMPDLVDAMQRKVQDQPGAVDLGLLVRSLWQGLQERHILAYMHDDRASEILASQGWDGSILDAPGDYLQVVDANVGFNKVDPNVRREIAYSVDLRDPEGASAELAVNYRNESQRSVEACIQEVESLSDYEQRMHGCFWNYVRVYKNNGEQLESVEQEPMPPGSLLSRYRFTAIGDAGPDAGPVEKGKVPTGLFFVLAPGEQRDVRLGWQFPSGLVVQEEEGWHYRLLAQKQSGTGAIPLRVDLILPGGSRVISASPEPAQVSGDVVTFSLNLAMDRQIDVLFSDGRSAD